MSRDFARFEEGIARISQQLPQMPRQRIVLNRLLFFTVQELEEAYRRHLEQHGLSHASFLALAMLMGSADNRLNPRDLSDALAASRTNVTRLADELVAAGWVSRTVSQEDRRCIDLALTDAGRDFFRSVLPGFWEMVEGQWQGLSDEEIALIDQLLRKARHGLPRPGEAA